MRIKKTLLTLALVWIATALNAQTTTITGELLDSLTRESEPFATIRVFKGGKMDKPVAMSIPSIVWKERREKRRCT